MKTSKEVKKKEKEMKELNSKELIFISGGGYYTVRHIDGHLKLVYVEDKK